MPARLSTRGAPKSASVPSSRTAIPIEPLPSWRRRCETRLLAPLAAGRAEDEGLPGPQPGGIEGPSRAAGRSDQRALAVEGHRGTEPVTRRGGRGLDGPALRPLAGTPAPGEDDDRSTLPVASRCAREQHTPMERDGCAQPVALGPALRGESGALAPPPIGAALEHVDRSTAGRSRRTDDQEVLLRGERGAEPVPQRAVLRAQHPALHPAGPLATEDMDRAGVDRGHREARPGFPGAR